MNNNISRRALIQSLGLGAVSALIPILQAEAQQASLPKRVCFITTPNGVSTEVVPTGSSTNFTLGRVLDPLKEHRSEVSYLHGIDMKTFTDVTPRLPNDHPPVVNQLLTAANSIDPEDGSAAPTSSTWQSSGISIDRFLANRLLKDEEAQTRLGVINAGVDTAAFAWKQVFKGESDPVFPEVNAGALFDRLFSVIGDDQLRQRASVLDAVKGQLDLLHKKIGIDDRRKLEAHLSAVRELERQLLSSGSGCELPELRNAPASDEDGYRQRGEDMMDLIAHAFACDQTRVATLQWANGAANHVFRSKGVNLAHHSITHDNFTANANNRALASQWYADRLDYFIRKLKSMPEGDGSVFDNTLLIWTSEHSDYGQHGRTNIPYVLAGSMGGAIRPGQFLDFSNNSRGHNDVYISVAQAMGFSDVTTFGNPDYVTGVLPGLLS